MPSTNNSNNLTRNVCPLRTASGGYEEDSSDIHNNNSSPKCQPSAFSNGPKERPSPLVSGYSDDSDLPRLSPIRTSSGTALNTWEKKQKLLPVAKEGNGRCLMSRSCFYEGPMYKQRTLMVNGGLDSSDLSLVGSLEDSITATSGWSALSEDVWQNSPQVQTTKTTDTVSEPELQSETVELECQRSKSSFSSFFDSLTNTINRGLHNLAVKVERATSATARELSSGMRSGTEAKLDAAFCEVHDNPKLFSEQKLEKEWSPADSRISTTIPSGLNPITPTVSYDTAFNLCGGLDLYEELETLCNEYAKKLNKLRTRLTDVDQQRLDGLVTHLYPIFDVVGSPSESDEECPGRSVDERLAHLCVPVDMLVGDSLCMAAQRERTSILEIANLVANPVNVLGSASQIPLTPQTSRCAELFVELESAVLHGKQSVERIHEDGIRRMAELSGSCINCLLEIANELMASADSPKKIHWPSDGYEIGMLLRSFIIRLMHNLESVTGSFVGALLGLGSAYDENLQDCSVGQKAQGLACDLELDSGTAVMKIQESLRNLLYVVVYVTFES